MLVAPAMGPTVARSSLEVMLETLRNKDEKPYGDSMPALPTRPVSKGRLPPSRRSLPVNIGTGMSGSEDKRLKEVVACIGGSTMANEEEMAESPYAGLPGLVSYEERSPTEITDSEPSTSRFSLGLATGDKMECALRKNLRVWCCLPNDKWELGRIQAVSGDVAFVKSSDGKELTASTNNLLPANPDILDGVDDLVQLSYLNEPSVIHNLQCRYSSDMIYTKAGPVLVAVNPFKEVPLYGDDTIAAYMKKHRNSPHVFATADAAYREMLRDGKNQSIIISGESGAGKTETAKYAMKYLAAVGAGSGMEEEVLHTNLILESFGNAKTLRNDNSSRFGKLIDTYFGKTGKICGANIQTFLLEKSRVAQRTIGERSFHVFYQLCAGASPHLKEKLNLKAAEEYEYLRQSNCLIIPNVSDAEGFHMLTEALSNLRFSQEDQENAFSMLATVLWLGNIGFSVVDIENHVEVDLSEGVINAAKLMGCEVSDLIQALSTQNLQVENQNIVQKLTVSQAIDARDALAKLIYASLFDWLVERLNGSLEVGKGQARTSISILDIYGFESFQRNSFEQLCINYANERLQQHFNRHLFKLEQEEYARNGIEWTNVGFIDNTECLNLFEKKPIGLFSLLDEESASPKATDMTFANKLKQQLSDNACFKVERGGAFRICHFAGEVLYNTSGFLEKNKDALHSESINLLSSCCCPLPKLFASHMHNKLHNSANPQMLNGADSTKQSVGRQFKGQLFKLMQQLESTNPHFIRCVKPNGQHLPGQYEYDLVLRQLRCCGLCEVVRISRSGYPTRMTHQQFAERYGFFLLGNVESQDPLGVSVNILQRFNILPGMYQVGYVKIFFRTGQIAILEEIRHQTLQGIVRVQKHFRGVKARRSFWELKNGATLLQSFARGWLAKKHFNNLKSPKRTNRLNARRYPSDLKLQDFEDSSKDQSEIGHAVVDDLKQQVLKAEAAFRMKEEENLALKQQIQQYETRWSDYEAKMKSMEEMWQKQMASLQMSLAAAKKSLARDDRPGRDDMTPNNRYVDSEDTLFGEFHTPESTPIRQNRGSVAVLPRNSDGTLNPVSHMVKEFEQGKKDFEEDAKFLIEVRSGHSFANVNPEEEFHKLKVRFAAWKKDYKLKLRDTKIELQKLAAESAKSRKKWWNIRATK